MSWNQVPDPKVNRADGYVNMLNKYGTAQDNSTAYTYDHEGLVPDMELTENYETNGLFAKIIDAPAEEAVKHGFDIGLKSPEVQEYIDDMLDLLEWEDNASTAIKWARLYGGALGVMFINDGGGIDEPLNWKRIRGIDEIRIYERAVVFPDYSGLYNYDPHDPARRGTANYGMPEYYHINSIYGQFWVHESRCLIFRNGILPERTMNPMYRFWGMPEYVRIKRELREVITTHSLGVKLLERSVQAIYSMQGLARLLGTDDGENEVIKRLQVIDMARGLLNSIAIDSEGENYDFKTATMTGVKEIVDSTCNMLSAVTNIAQTVLFGRSPAGQNSTGDSDLENYYNYVERHQKLMLRNNLRKLLDIIVRVGLKTGKLTEEPRIKLTFNPLWSMSDSEQATVNQAKAQTQQLKAQTAQVYVDMGALDPTEVRKGLAQEDEFQVEELLNDVDEEDLWGGEGIVPQTSGQTEMEQPEKPEEPTEKPPVVPPQEKDSKAVQAADAAGKEGVGVLVVRDDGRVLVGLRADNHLICGPGGHIEPGETPARAAIRETQEEFNITPLSLKPLGQLEGLDPQYGKPHIFLCTDFEGDPLHGGDREMAQREWRVWDAIEEDMFPPFAESLKLWKSTTEETSENNTQNQLNRLTSSDSTDRMIVETSVNDGGPGSGRFPKGSGDSDFSPEAYSKAVEGVKTTDGKTVKGMWKHALSQAKNRDVYPTSITKALCDAESTYPGNTGNRTVYVRKGLHIVLDNDSSEVVTVIYKGKEK